MAKERKQARKLYQWVECGGHWAKLTLEWSPARGVDLPQNWEDSAEEQADKTFMASAPMVRNIVQAMLGKTV